MDDGSARSIDSVPGASAGAKPYGLFAVLWSFVHSRFNKPSLPDAASGPVVGASVQTRG